MMNALPSTLDVLIPSQEILPYVERELPTLLELARAGTHRFNPYHNLVHELQVAYWANAICLNDQTSDHEPNRQRNRKILVAACLLHDHNHSGGRDPDSENIKAALEVVKRQDHLLDVVERAFISDLIKVTEFSGVSSEGELIFAQEPSSWIYKMAIRDADLCSIYTDEGRRLLLGLQTELGKPWKAMMSKDREAALEANAKILRQAPMYTEFGSRLKRLHLEKSLDAFALLVKQISI